MRNNKKAAAAVKYGLYTLLLLLLYVLQSVPGLFAIRGAKPILVIPAAIVIAMLEGELVGGIFGAFGGLLCDMSALTLFGFNGFVLCLFCIASGLLVEYLMRCNLLGCMLFVGLAALARGGLEYLFVYGMWGYDNAWMVFANQTLPAAVYTVAVSPLLFYPMRGIQRRQRATAEDYAG